MRDHAVLLWLHQTGPGRCRGGTAGGAAPLPSVLGGERLRAQKGRFRFPNIPQREGDEVLALLPRDAWVLRAWRGTGQCELLEERSPGRALEVGGL